MKIIILTLLFGLLGYTISKPLDSKDATNTLVEIEKQRLIKFPEELEQPSIVEGNDKHDEAKRILQEIEKINRALGYVKKHADQTRSPAILDSSQYLFPNTGYQPFHVQSPQVIGVNGETLLLPSIRSVKLESAYHNKASEYNVPPTKKSQKQKVTKPQNPLFFKPQRVELAAPQTKTEQKLLPTHFVIPVRLYKQNKQQYVEKHIPQEYKIKGYKIVGDIDHFYGKTKSNKTSPTGSREKSTSTAKYHLFFLPEEISAKTSSKDIKAADASSKENSSREEKLTHSKPYKVQTNTQAIATGNTINATSSAQLVRKRLGAKPQKGGNNNSVISASTVVKVQPTANGNGLQLQQQQGHQQQQQGQQQQHQQGHQQQQQGQQQQQQQQHYEKPTAPLQITQIIQPPEATPVFQPTKPNNNNQIKNPVRPLLNIQNNNNNNNNNNKNRPLLELQQNINSINNATTNAIKNAFQNIFRLPFRPQDPTKPVTATEYTPPETMPLQMPQLQPPQQQQQHYYTGPNLPAPQAPPQYFYGHDNFQSDHLDSDYRWDDENVSIDSSNPDDQDSYNNSQESAEPEEKKIFGNLLKYKQESQRDALKHGGIIIQRLKVRKGGIAIAGPGGVATAGSGGTAIVGPGGYALTHPRSLTIAGPGAKVIAIPSDVDLKDALQRTNLDSQMFPREGRIVATGPTVYYAPPTGDYVEI